VTSTIFSTSTSLVTSTSFTTSRCDSSSPPSGGPGSSGSTWTSTHSVSVEQFTEGFSKALAAKQRMKVKLGSAYHHVGVKSVSGDSATIEISSDPVEIILKAGQDAKADVDGDGVYDLYVKLNGIEGTKADVLVQKISEEVPEGAESVTGTTSIETTGEIVGEEVEEGSLLWLWIVLVLIVIVVVVWIVVSKKK